MTHALRNNKITRLFAAAVLSVILLSSASWCESTSGTYQGGNDSEPYFR